MKILFMSLLDFETLDGHGIYPDLLKKFVSHGDEVYVLSPFERHIAERKHVIHEAGAIIVKVKILPMQKTNLIKKGVSMLTIDRIFIKAIKKNFQNIKFDLVLYPTPPITLLRAISYVKKRDNAKTYLLLKDIFPQNAVDIGLMRKTGIMGLLHKYFKGKEKKLYSISDNIGCMSEANKEYLISHNPEINPEDVEICPNSIDVIDMRIDTNKKNEMRKKYGIPLEKKVFVYGGNLGKPQGIPFLIKCLKAQSDNQDVFFLIIGSGTEFNKLARFFDENKFKNMKLMKSLPRNDYEHMVAACDVGMIFLDHRFTIPNFPSRLLSYMQAGIPVLAVTDPNTDIGNVIVDGGFGWWCESNDVKAFNEKIQEACKSNLVGMGGKGFKYLESHYNIEQSYDIIMKHYRGKLK